MSEKKAVVGKVEGVIALLMFVVAFVFGLLSQ